VKYFSSVSNFYQMHINNIIEENAQCNSLERITDFVQSCSQFVAVEVPTVVLVFVLERRLIDTHIFRPNYFLALTNMSTHMKHLCEQNDRL